MVFALPPGGLWPPCLLGPGPGQGTSGRHWRPAADRVLSVCYVALSVCYKAGPGADTGEEGKSPPLQGGVLLSVPGGRGCAGGRTFPAGRLRRASPCQACRPTLLWPGPKGSPAGAGRSAEAVQGHLALGTRGWGPGLKVSAPGRLALDVLWPPLSFPSSLGPAAFKVDTGHHVLFFFIRPRGLACWGARAPMGLCPGLLGCFGAGRGVAGREVAFLHLAPARGVRPGAGSQVSAQPPDGDSLSFRGSGGGGGEPGDGGPAREAEAPAAAPGAVPLPAAGVSACHPHQVAPVAPARGPAAGLSSTCLSFSSRGKCSVTLLNETESLKSYLEREVRPSPPSAWLLCETAPVPTLSLAGTSSSPGLAWPGLSLPQCPGASVDGHFWCPVAAAPRLPPF